jgi:diguanylate cyclase (GGDEF)-like protein
LRIAFVHQMIEVLSQQITQRITVPNHVLGSQDQFRYIALYDPDTGLPNRFLFDEQLHRSLAYSRRYQTRMIVMFIQLEGIMTYRETLGQTAITEILTEITRNMLNHKRESDTLAYIGNGEFGLILENLSDENILLIGKRIRDIITESQILEKNKVLLHPSISVCTKVSDCVSLEDIRSEEIDLLFNQGIPVLLSEAD